MKAKKHTVSKFGKLVKKAGLSQTDVQEALTELGVHKAQMTVHRWCTGKCKCRDLFVAKKLAEVLKIEVDDVVEAFE